VPQNVTRICHREFLPLFRLRPAAIRNALLYTELKWTFGGKPQRGWFLYTGALGRLLGTESEPATEDFARAMSRWQAKSGLSASGMLDEETLYAMVAQWQSARLKDGVYPQPDQLLSHPLLNSMIPRGLMNFGKSSERLTRLTSPDRGGCR